MNYEYRHSGPHPHNTLPLLQQSQVNFIEVLETVDFPCRVTVHLKSAFSRTSIKMVEIAGGSLDH